MENAAKALTIAGGVLLAVIILALLVYTIGRMSSIPKQQEYAQEIEQLSKFNQQFEVYDKSLMYGVDVVSCLNKVIDNNSKSEKYYDGLYNITISIKTIKDVYDEFEIYYINNNTSSKVQIKEQKWTGTPRISIGSVNNIFPNNKTVTNGSKITNVTSGTIIENTNGIVGSNLKSGVYTYSKGNENQGEMLKELSSDTTEMERIAVNNNNDFSKATWTKVIWKTAVYNFKSKKFKCLGLEYDKEGRINKISFIEV